MGKGERLRKKSQFDDVREHGRTWVCEFLVMKAMPNGLGWNRCGFVVSKRLGNAVARNRVKRLFREVIRLTPTEEGWDMVFIARNGAKTANYQQIEAAVTKLLQKARILTGMGEAERTGKA
jgi:ribonuclease P protein component